MNAIWDESFHLIHGRWQPKPNTSEHFKSLIYNDLHLFQEGGKKLKRGLDRGLFSAFRNYLISGDNHQSRKSTRVSNCVRQVVEANTSSSDLIQRLPNARQRSTPCAKRGKLQCDAANAVKNAATRRGSTPWDVYDCDVLLMIAKSSSIQRPTARSKR